MNLDNLFARLAAARASLPDPGDVPAPNERERISELIALLERCRHSLHKKRRRVSEAEATVAEIKADLELWRDVEVELHEELTLARAALRDLPRGAFHRDRERAEARVKIAEEQIEWSRTVWPIEGGASIVSDPFEGIVCRVFGVRPDRLGTLAPKVVLKDRLAIEEPALVEHRQALDSEAKTLERTLDELERQAA